MASKPEKKSRPLHFYTDMSGETSCGKNNQRVRSTSSEKTWCDPRIADGRRCPECSHIVAARQVARGPKPAGGEGA